jgi:ribosomal protein S18 acetylase RimI-like enzyme
MEIRRAEADDAKAVREVAHRSLEASYTLSPQTIEGAVAQWYDDDVFGEKIDDDDHLLLVAEREREIVGFSESEQVADEGELLWLHVAPDYRGEGIATRLFDVTRERLSEMGAERCRGRVLRDTREGNDFYHNAGFEKVGEARVSIDGTDYVENVYADETGPIERLVTEEGQAVYLDREDSERGSVAPFMAVYSDADRTDRYGYFCSNCDSLANAMDSMGRIECENCGNRRKPTRWDAAYM